MTASHIVAIPVAPSARKTAFTLNAKTMFWTTTNRVWCATRIAEPMPPTRSFISTTSAASIAALSPVSMITRSTPTERNSAIARAASGFTSSAITR